MEYYRNGNTPVLGKYMLQGHTVHHSPAKTLDGLVSGQTWASRTRVRTVMD